MSLKCHVRSRCCIVSVGSPDSVAVDKFNGFVYFGHDGGNITQMTLDGSSTKDIFSTGKLNL